MWIPITWEQKFWSRWHHHELGKCAMQCFGAYEVVNLFKLKTHLLKHVFKGLLQFSDLAALDTFWLWGLQLHTFREFNKMILMRKATPIWKMVKDTTVNKSGYALSNHSLTVCPAAGLARDDVCVYLNSCIASSLLCLSHISKDER